MSYLVLVRHGESLWNKKGIWAGKTDISLSDKGIGEAQTAASLIKDIHFDNVFASSLKRARETLEYMRPTLHVPQTYATDKALDERDYGDLTGKNKEELKKEVGVDQYLKWRRSFSTPPPHGESLKDVYNRVVPYYKKEILPIIQQGKNVLIVAHGNSLRALIKFIEQISDSEIPNIEIPTGSVIVYSVDKQGTIVQKEVRE